MAMGADDSILVLAKEELLDPYMTAKTIKAAIERSGKKTGYYSLWQWID